MVVIRDGRGDHPRPRWCIWWRPSAQFNRVCARRVRCRFLAREHTFSSSVTIRTRNPRSNAAFSGARLSSTAPGTSGTETQDLCLALPARAMPSGPGKRKAACLTHEPGATSAPNQATSAARPASQKPTSATAPTAGQAKTKQSTMQAFYAPMPVMASAASTAAPSATDPSPPPKLRSLYRCAVLAATDAAPNLQQILCDSTEGWIGRYHSSPASASVELADLTTRLAQKIDRQQAELAGNPPPPVPPTADGGGHDDAASWTMVHLSDTLFVFNGQRMQSS